MKILLCHNYYQQAGGEDQVFTDEALLLESRDHEVIRFTRHNDDIPEIGRLDVAWKTVWNRETYDALRALIRRERPQVMHCTNTFPLISPAAYYAAHHEGIPVLQSLHNYRLLCPNALLLRDGRVCEECLGKSVPWPAVQHGCYRNDRIATAVLTAMLSLHRIKQTWSRAVDLYVALTEFSRQKFIEGGLPEDRIVVKPNFVHPDPGQGAGGGGYAVMVGRLSPEKGIDTLLTAWSRLAADVPLKIVGTGPLEDQVRRAAANDARIELIGHRTIEDVHAIVGEAACLVMPSICYEHCPKSLIEAFAKGTPVVASRLGAMQELVGEGQTGLHFEPGNAEDLAAKIAELMGDRPRLLRMREAARAVYERKYTAERNYEQLIEIYERAQINPESATADVSFAWPRKVDLFGVGVTPTKYDEAAETIITAAQRGIPGVVSCHAVHALVTASCDPQLRDQVNTFDMITPDGQPVRWALNLLHGTELKDRVYGPWLMLELCRRAAEVGVSIYLYGGSPAVVEALGGNLREMFPDLDIAGHESPPFRRLTPEEDEAVVERINASGAGLIFIGLGCPKQDIFAYQHRDRFRGVQICVGAAFDFHAGAKRSAPHWIGRCGLEWLYRLVQEPRRLWRRYLVTNSIYLAKLGLALLKTSLSLRKTL